MASRLDWPAILDTSTFERVLADEEDERYRLRAYAIGRDDDE